MAYPAYLSWPDPADVTLRKLDATPGGGTVSELTLCAQQGVPSRAEREASGGAYQGLDTEFLFAVALLDGQVPRPGDLVVDADGVTYAILRVQYLGIFAWYACYCVNLSLYLPDTITVKRATYSKGAAGGRAFAFDQTAYTLSARVQVIEEEWVTADKVLGVSKVYDVTLPQQVTLTAGDRIEWGSEKLDVERLTRSQRIDEFPVARCVRSINQ